MSQLFQLANARPLLWLNHALAQNPGLHGFAAFMSGTGAHLLVIATLLVLWFWPESKDSSVLIEVRLPPRPREDGMNGTANGAANNTGGAARRGSGLGVPAAGKIAGQKLAARISSARVSTRVTAGAKVRIASGDQRSPAHRRPVDITRLESRAKVLVLIAVIVAGYVAAHLLAMVLGVPRPFATYLPVRGDGDLFGAIAARSPGSFPADSAAALGALPVALFFWGRRIRWLAWAWVLLALGLGAGRVAVGVHYPGDVVAGATLGAVLAALAMNAFRGDGRVSRLSEALARGFDPANAPFCYFLYLLLALLAVEFAFGFEHVFAAFAVPRADLAYRLGQS